MDKYVGKKLDGRYEIRELIGIGGMANVYRCYDTIDDREVAIKILKDEFLNNDDFIRRFKNESKAIAVLSHPNIVKVYDVSFGDMIQYIVMEYIDGITLKEYISQQGVLSWRETVHLVTQVLKALSHAHSKGVVHRDIKPQNMMLLSDGTIKVTDFGIARFSNSTRTMTEQAIGSVHYIAPEQAKGDITDGKTDIYSIGVMMYEMLTGKLPFDGDNAVSVALMHLQITPDAPRSINSSIPEGIEEITLKAMQKQPADRYQSAQEMLADIDRFRMNPSVRFEYKYLYDKQPTKYVEAVNRGKSHRAEEFSKEVEAKDDDSVRHSLTFPIIVGIIIALCISLCVCIPMGIYKATRTENINEVDVPEFVGLNASDIAENPDWSTFNFEYDYVYSDEYDLGTIIEQNPTPGSKKIKATGTINLTVNSAQEDIMIPTIYGLEESAARALLNKNGFYEVENIYVSDSTSEEGTVIRSYPQVGTTVSVGETVFLYVVGGNNEELVSVPTSVIGYTAETAQQTLEDLGFIVTTVERASSKTPGTVLSMSILGGDVPKGTPITLYVSAAETESTVTITVSLPENVANAMYLTAEQGGVSVSSGTVYSSSVTYSFSVTGTGTDIVTVKLDDQLYSQYTVDFNAGTYTTDFTNTYVPSEIPGEDVTTSTEPQETTGSSVENPEGE